MLSTQSLGISGTKAVLWLRCSSCMDRAEQRPDQCFNDKCRISNKLAHHHHYYYYYLLLLLLSFRPSTRELSSVTWWIGPVVLTGEITE